MNATYVSVGKPYSYYIRLLIRWHATMIHFDNKDIQICRDDIEKTLMARALRQHRINELERRLP